jgi:hypothetical protein
MQDWLGNPGNQTGVLQKLVEGVDGVRTPPTLCSAEFPISTQAAAQRWRDTAGTGGGNVVDLFTYTTNCSGADIVVSTANFSLLGCTLHMCTSSSGPDYVVDYGVILPIRIGANPALFGPGRTWPDGSAHTTRDITHELGHALGHADYHGCASGNTLMDTDETCPLEPSPTALDEANYHDAYHVDAVSSFSASPDGEHRVRLTWNASNLHNESQFLLTWRNQCTGQWQVLETSPKNTSSKIVDGQQGGRQDYQIVPLTFADPEEDFVGDVSPPNSATIESLLPAPVGLASSFTSTTAGLMTWASAGGPHHYHVRTDTVSPSGDFAACWVETYGTQFTTQVPTQHLARVYNKVMACTAPPDDLCSPMSEDHTMSGAVDNSSWDYAFTFYRVIGDVRFQFINSNPGGTRLQLHIRRGSSPTSPEVAITPCIPWNTKSDVLTYAASSFEVPGDDILGTQGHDVLNTDACDTTENDNTTIGWGIIPRVGLPSPPPVGGLADRPEVTGAPAQAGGPSGAGSGWLTALGAAAVAGAIVLAGTAWRVKRRAGLRSGR